MHLGLPGLEFEPGGKRYYPDGRIAAQLLGVTDPDNNGVCGLELGLEKEIRAADAGGKVVTSIDMRVQYILAHEVETARETFSARAAGGIVMDVRTGEMLAMVSLPDFDPNQRHQATATPPATSWRRMSTSWVRCSRSSPSRWRSRTTP